MFKIHSSNIKQSQEWLDDTKDVDWFGDEPDLPGRLVGDENLGDYLVDDIEEEPTAPHDIEDLETEPTDIQPTQPERPDHRDEIPTLNEMLTPNATREVVYDNIDQLLSDAMKSNKPGKQPDVIGFDYTNRHGAYAGWRIVEPHYTFYATTTGNSILVTWDRDVEDIRAFIVGNIHPKGVRYIGENFIPKPEIMKGISS